jgi:hypothetical protein
LDYRKITGFDSLLVEDYPNPLGREGDPFMGRFADNKESKPVILNA